MPAFVKNEACWAKAKRAATRAGIKPDTDGWYAFANKWYHENCKGKRQNRPPVLRDGERLAQPKEK